MTPSQDTPRSSARQRTVGNPRQLRWEGRQWSVREVTVPDYDRRGGTNLIFENPEVMRRVRAFPPNWRELSDAELYSLSLGA